MVGTCWLADSDPCWSDNTPSFSWYPDPLHPFDVNSEHHLEHPKTSWMVSIIWFLVSLKRLMCSCLSFFWFLCCIWCYFWYKSSLYIYWCLRTPWVYFAEKNIKRQKNQPISRKWPILNWIIQKYIFVIFEWSGIFSEKPPCTFLALIVRNFHAKNQKNP